MTAENPLKTTPKPEVLTVPDQENVEAVSVNSEKTERVAELAEQSRLQAGKDSIEAAMLLKKLRRGSTEAKSETSETSEKNEGHLENIIENIAEIPPEIGENIEEIKSNLGKLVDSIHEYEELADTDGINFENEEDFKRELEVLRIAKINYYYSHLLSGFNFTDYIKDTPYIRQSLGLKKSDREVKYLPKTVEVVFLANDEHFSTQLNECASKIEKYGLLKNEVEHIRGIPDFQQWTNFLTLFAKVPRGNEDKIKNWLLTPSIRVSHSTFTHVTSELALPGILDGGSIKSFNQVPNASETGAVSTGGADELVKSAIYFDQNGLSLNYGFPMQAEEKGYDYNKIRRILFVTRGDRLLHQGVLDRNSFEEKHPFIPASDPEGSMFVSTDKEGAEIPIDEFIIVIPEGADDLEKKIHETYPGAVIKTYDKSLSLYIENGVGGDKSEDIDSKMMRNLRSELKNKFGPVDVPNIGMASLNFKTGHKNSIPLTVQLRSPRQDERLKKVA